MHIIYLITVWCEILREMLPRNAENQHSTFCNIHDGGVHARKHTSISAQTFVQGSRMNQKVAVFVPVTSVSMFKPVWS